MKNFILTLVVASNFLMIGSSFADMPATKLATLRNEAAESHYKDLDPASSMWSQCHGCVVVTEKECGDAKITVRKADNTSCADRSSLLSSSPEDQSRNISRYKCIAEVDSGYNINHEPFYHALGSAIHDLFVSKNLCRP